MNRLWLLPIAVASAILAASCTQAVPPEESASAPASVAPTATEDVEAVVTQLERDWVAAIINNDVEAVDQLLADDFVGTSPTAHTFIKELALADLRSGKYVVESMTLDEIGVNQYGDNMAVAFTSQEEKSMYGDADTSGHYHFTDVWVKRNGRWQVVASHGTRFAQGH